MTEVSERLSDDRIRNVLVLAPPLSEQEDVVCMDLLRSDRLAAINVLSVTMTLSPEDLIEIWLRHVGPEFPAETVVLNAGAGAGAGPETGTGQATEPGNPAAGHGDTEALRVATVADPGDLTGLGVEITRHLDRWDDADGRGEPETEGEGQGEGESEAERKAEAGGEGGTGEGTTSMLCFRSLSTLLQYADLEAVFKFLHTLTSRIETGDARGHYHMDPTTHDERTVQTLLQLFDAAVRIEDGSVDVRTRPEG